MDINYTSGRKLNKDLITRLASCEYIEDYRNIFITGATGCGKSFMACAFGMEACKHYYKTMYVRLPQVTFTGGEPTMREDIFELIHHRRKRSSTIFCSQYSKEGWYEQLGGAASPLADAILDRIVHDGYDIDIVPIDPSKDLSMREVYGLSATEYM